MSTKDLEKLFKTEKETNEEILSDFAMKLVSAAENLVALHGKERFLEMIASNE